MTLVVDAGPLIAMADEEDPRRDQIGDIIRTEPGRLILSPYVAAEADYFIGDRFGRTAERLFLQDLASGLYEVEGLTEDEHRLAVEVDAEHPGMGVADLSIVVLAARYDTRRILTFDERDFRRVEPLQGGVFTLLPADASTG